MRSNNILEINSLLEYKYYINSDFEKLKKILDNILPNNSNKIFKSKKKKKELLEDDDIDIDYEYMDAAEIFDLVNNKPNDMSDEEYYQFLKKNGAYNYLIKIYGGKTKP